MAKPILEGCYKHTLQTTDGHAVSSKAKLRYQRALDVQRLGPGRGCHCWDLNTIAGGVWPLSDVISFQGPSIWDGAFFYRQLIGLGGIVFQLFFIRFGNIFGTAEVGLLVHRTELVSAQGNRSSQPSSSSTKD